MAETSTPAGQPTGALASVTGFFRDLVDQAKPVVSSYLDYRAARENAKSSATSNLGPGSPMAASGQDWRTTGAGSGPITSAPWFPFAIIGGVVGFGLLLILALRRK